MPKMQKLDVGKLLGDVPDEYMFRCHDGRLFRNMRELRDGLDAVSDETFAYHANPEKNDFCIWVKDIIRDEKLARDLSKATSRLEAEKRVAARVSFLSSRLR